MHLVLFRDWIRRIYATRDDELGCEEVLDAIANYVDTEIAGAPAAERYPRVLLHLKQCPHCSDIYLALRQAALLEDQEPAAEMAGLEHRRSQ